MTDRDSAVTGETPKIRRGSRSVPMADRVGAELERHYQRSAFQSDDREGELVDRAFGQGSIQGSNLRETERTKPASDPLIKPD